MCSNLLFVVILSVTVCFTVICNVRVHSHLRFLGVNYSLIMGCTVLSECIDQFLPGLKSYVMDCMYPFLRLHGLKSSCLIHGRFE